MENCFNCYGNKLSYGNNKPMIVTNDDKDDGIGTLTPIVEDEVPQIIPEQDMLDKNGCPIPEADNVVDNYINMEVCLQKGESEAYGKIVGLCYDKEGK